MTNNIIKSLRNVSNFSKYAGLFPFNINAKGQVILSKIWLLWAILIQSFFLISLYRFVFSERLEFISEELFSTVLTGAELFIFQLIMITHLIWITRCRKQLENAFIILAAFNYNKIIASEKTMKIICISVFLMLSLADCFLYRNDLYVIVFIAIDCLQSLFLIAAVFQFIDLLKICSSCFIYITDSLKASEYVSKSVLKKHLENNNKLSECCEILNSCFGPFLLTTFVSSFAIISSSLYYIYDYWRYPYTTFYCTIWITIFLIAIKTIVKSCENTIDKANDTYKFISESVIKNDHISIDNNIHLILVTGNKLKFTAFGYFTINYGLFCSIIAGSVSYFLVLTEFNNLSKTGGNKLKEEIN